MSAPVLPELTHASASPPFTSSIATRNDESFLRRKRVGRRLVHRHDFGRRLETEPRSVTVARLSLGLLEHVGQADEREVDGVVALERRKSRRNDGRRPMVAAHGVQGDCDLATHAGLDFERGAQLGDRQQRDTKATTLARRPAELRIPSCRGRNRRP